MNELFVSCPEKIEPLLIRELNALGIAQTRPGFRGVFVPQIMPSVYQINYCSRLATRVLWPLLQFPCRDRNDLYTAAKQIPWLNLLDETKTFAIDANVTHPNIRNSLYGAQVMKDGVCDHIREKKGARPSIDVKNPDIQLNLFIHNNRGTISFDTSGTPLYKRGWRTLSSPASIQETLAAALLMQAGYERNAVLCDPFCGSGTFLVEAALIATRTPPGMFRNRWGFLAMPEHNPTEWDAFKKKIDAERIPLPQGRIFGADRDPESITICKQHLRNVGLETIDLQCCSISSYTPPFSPSLVISNPPYGKRLDTSIEIYRELGRFLKRTHTKQALLLAPDSNLIKAAQIPIQSTFAFHHGGLNINAYRFLLDLTSDTR